MHYPNLFSPKARRASLWARVSLWLVAALFAVSLGALPAQAQPSAYVANNGSNSVSVIDAATNTVLGCVGVGTGPVGVAITPDGAYAYVTNPKSSGFPFPAPAKIPCNHAFGDQSLAAAA